MPVRASSGPSRHQQHVPRSMQPPHGASPSRLKGSAGVRYARGPAQPEDSLVAVVLMTLYKMFFKWPYWLQAKMLAAMFRGLPEGLSMGCAHGTIVGVEEGFSHTVADMTCMQVDLGLVSLVGSTVAHVCDMGRPEVAAACSFAAMLAGNVRAVRMITCQMVDQDQYAQAVACSYETVLLGARSGRPEIIANQTVQVGRAGQPYVNMLADVVAALVRDGYGEDAARVCLLVIAGGNLRLAMRISSTMVRRRHYREAARVSAQLVAAGHEDFKSCMAGASPDAPHGKALREVHPNVCRFFRKVVRAAAIAAVVGAAMAVASLPYRRPQGTRRRRPGAQKQAKSRHPP